MLNTSVTLQSAMRNRRKTHTVVYLGNTEPNAVQKVLNDLDFYPKMYVTVI